MVSFIGVTVQLDYKGHRLRYMKRLVLYGSACILLANIPLNQEDFILECIIQGYEEIKFNACPAKRL
jgi:hypothetical protein